MGDDRQGGRGTEDEGDAPIESPPEGASCVEHPERPALAVCPRCGGYACLACWHHAIRRCHTCLMRDPAAAAPPIPWEVPRRHPLSRFLGTLATALRPTATAPAFARGDVGSAISFFALTFVPLAALGGIVPYTRTLFFGGGRLEVRAPSSHALVLDVLQALGIGLLVCTLAWLSLALPYMSLARAYAQRGHSAAPARVMLYRGFLVPLALVVFSILAYVLPTPPTAEQALVLLCAPLLPILALITAMRVTARMASGVGPLASFATTLIPLALFTFALRLVVGLMAMPSDPAAP